MFTTIAGSATWMFLYAELSETEHQLREVAELRETIEPKSAELAELRAPPANLIALQEVLRRSITNATPDESLRCDLGFHMLLARSPTSATNRP